MIVDIMVIFKIVYYDKILMNININWMFSPIFYIFRRNQVDLWSCRLIVSRDS